MVFGLDLFASDDACDYALLIREESSALGPHIFASVHAFFHPNTEKFVETHFLIHDQRKRKLVLFSEIAMALGRITTHSDDFVAGSLDRKSVV